MQLKHASSPCAKKFMLTLPAWKVMLTVFWISQGVFVINQSPEVSWHYEYWMVLSSVMHHNAIWSQCPGLLTTVILLHQPTYSSTNAGENWFTSVGTFGTSILQPQLTKAMSICLVHWNPTKWRQGWKWNENVTADQIFLCSRFW